MREFITADRVANKIRQMRSHAYERAYFYTTQLYGLIQKWEENNNKYQVLFKAY